MALPIRNGGTPRFRRDEAVAKLDHAIGHLSEVVFSVTLPLPLVASSEYPRAGPRLRIGAVHRTFRIRRRLRAEDATRPWLLEIELDVTIPDPEAVLASSEGFLVDDADGQELGVVEELETGRDGAVSALVVAGGWFGRRRTRVPVEEIDEIVPAHRRIVVRR